MGIAEESVVINWKNMRERMQIKIPFKTPRSVKILIIVVGICFTSVSIKIYPSTESLGYFAGECLGTCELTYTITSDRLTIDRYSNQTDIHQHEIILGDFNDFKVGVPLILLFHPHNIGCPDCNDGGALTLSFNLFGVPFKYALEKGYHPWYFKNMDRLINDRINKIGTIYPYKK